jgi:hypothetical protein
MGGKSGKTTVGYKYSAGFQMILAKIIDKILRIYCDQNLAWSGTQQGSGIIPINAPNLFGGSSGSDPEGGVVGNVAFQQGIDGQTPNSYLQSKLGAAIPASIGVSGLVSQGVYLGNSPYLKQWSITAERIHIDDDGDTQWYDTKAAIFNGAYVINDSGVQWRYLIVSRSDSTDYSSPSFDDSAWQVGTSPFGSSYDPSVIPYGFNPTPSTVTPQAIGCWLRTNIDIENLDNDFVFEAWVDNGITVWVNGVQVINDYGTYGHFYTTTIPKANFVKGSNAIAVKGIDDANTGPNVWFWFSWRLKPQNQDTYDMNPAHMIRECLVNNEWGYGYDESTDVDDTNFQAVADELYTEQFGLSYMWDDPNTSLDDVMQKFEDHVDCCIYVDRSTLKWTIQLIRADYDASTLPVFSMDSEITSVDSFARPAFMDLINTVQITYATSIDGTSPTITVPNPALLLQQGVTQTQQTTYDMICNPSLAARVAQRDLLTQGQPLASGTIYLVYNAETKVLHRGSVCKLTMPLHNMNETVVRVTEITFGDGTTKAIKMSFVEDKFALNNSVPIPPPAPPSTGGESPVAVAVRAPMEIPYYFLVRGEGQTNVDNQLASNPETAVFGVAAARPANGLSADLYIDPGSGYAKVGIADFCPYGVLVADLPLPGVTGSDTFQLTSYEDLDEVEDNHIWLVDDEFVSGTFNGTDTFTTVKRGVLDTLPALHTAGTAVLGVMDYLDSDNVDYAAGETINAKLCTVATGGTLDLASAPADSVLLAGRAVKPYPPGQVKIAGAYFPATVSGTFTVTWAHRNRQQQTSGVPIGFTDDSITPAVNTRYTLQFKDSTGAVLVTQSNIGPPTANVTLNYTGNVTMELWTVDDNGASTYKYSILFAYTPPSGTPTNTITATQYTPVDNTPIIDGGSANG